jgi:hypothetical protein
MLVLQSLGEGDIAAVPARAAAIRHVLEDRYDKLFLSLGQSARLEEWRLTGVARPAACLGQGFRWRQPLVSAYLSWAVEYVQHRAEATNNGLDLADFDEKIATLLGDINTECFSILYPEPQGRREQRATFTTHAVALRMKLLVPPTRLSDQQRDLLAFELDSAMRRAVADFSAIVEARSRQGGSPDDVFASLVRGSRPDRDLANARDVLRTLRGLRPNPATAAESNP